MADSLVRLRIDSNEFDAKLKTASQNLQSYFDKVKQGAGTFEYLDDGVLDCAKALGQLSTKSNTARGSISEMTSSFTEWSLRYKQMTEAEKNTPLGREIKNSLDQLKTRILDTKKDLASINQELSGSKFGQFGSIIDGIGRRMGISANLTELLTSKTALMTAGIGAAVTAIYKGTEAWTKYNSELSKQDQQTQVITGLDGSEAEHMTDVMRALSNTYKVDFRQAVEAANTLMSQFGVSGSEAIQLIKDGMQGMIQGDGPKLLSMIEQYAPAFRDAGVSASQLVAVIHNSEGGIFTAQNMSAIVLGMKNIRLMTKQTSDALSQLGIDGKQMSKQLNEGTLTVFDALKQVASKLKDVDSNSKAAGEVMQTVFGRQGATAGTNLAKAIETLNTNLKETKKQTGDVGDAFADLQIATEKLNTAIREAFSYDGWEQMTIGIKSTLISTLADVIEKFGEVKGLLAGITTGQAKQNKYGTTGTPDEVERDLEALSNADADTRESMYQNMLQKYENRFAEATNEVQSAQRYFDHYDNMGWVGEGFPVLNKGMNMWNASTKVNTARSNAQVEEDVLSEFRNRANNILNPPKSKKKQDTDDSDTKLKSSTPKTETQQNDAAIAKLTEEYQNLATAAKTADDAQKAGLTERMTAIQGEIGTLQERNAELKTFADEAKGVKVEVDVPNSLPQLTKQLEDLQQAQSKSLDTSEWVEYQKQIDVTNTKIDILKGKWKDGQVATFSFEEKQPDKMVFTADNKDVLTKLVEIREAVGGIEIDDKTLTVTANTEEAVDALRKIDELTIQPKAVSFTADNKDVLTKLVEVREAVGGIEIDDKTLTVTANTEEAVDALSKIDELTIQPKEVSFMADNAEVLDKLREVNGVSIDDKTLTVTADTAEAYNKVQELIGGIDGTSVSFEVKPEIKALPTLDDYRIQAMIEIDTQNTKVDTNTLQTLLKDSIQNGIDITSLDLTPITEQIGNGIDVSDDKWQEIYDEYNQLKEAIGKDPIKINFDAEDESSGETKTYGSSETVASSLDSMSSGISNIASSLEQLGLELPEGLSNVITGIKAVTTILTSISTILSAIQVLSSVNSIPFFARGGIVHAAGGMLVPGHDYSDSTPVMVSSGELILNKAQQNTIANLLQEGNGGKVSGTPYVSGEQIYLGLTNYLRRSGRGELLTARG